MAKKIFIFIIMITLLITTAFAQEKMLPVEINGDEVSYLTEQGKVTAKGNVHIKYQNVELFCQDIEYNTKINEGSLHGNVKVIREKTTVYGENITYNFAAQTARIEKIRFETDTIYGQAANGQKTTDKYIFNKGYITTCDKEKPHYRLSAKQIILYPNEKITARNMVLRLGDAPVFYFPYFSQSLKDKSFPVELSPGKNHDLGTYILSRWRYYLNDAQRGKIHADYYENRGLGIGITHKSESPKYGDAILNVYAINDNLYKQDKRGELFLKYPERVSLANKYLESDRYKIQGAYALNPWQNFSLKAEVSKFSDEYFAKDFFYREYEKNVHPLSYMLADYSFENSAVSLYAQKRFNQFWAETEYLPQLQYDWYRQNIADTNFYFESKSTAANLTVASANVSDSNKAVRLNSHNILSYSMNHNWLSINPYAGAYTTYYSRDVWNRDDIFRWAPETGITLSAKSYRIFDTGINLAGTEIKQIRHVITPEISYSYIHPPSISSSQLYQFDAIDNLVRSEIVTLALKNKLQAKNDKKIWDILYFSPSVTYQIDSLEAGSYWNKFNTDFKIYPFDGLSLTGKSEYDITNKYLNIFNIDLGVNDISEKKDYRVAVGHRYLYKDSSQGTLSLDKRLTDKIKFMNYTRYEYKTGKAQEQQYTLRTDLHCWWMDIGLDVNKTKDCTFWLVFRLKAFPDVNTGFRHTYEGIRESY